MFKVPKQTKKKTVRPKSTRESGDWVAEIKPLPPAQAKPIIDNDTVEVDKWLKLVESYWQRNADRKKSL